MKLILPLLLSASLTIPCLAQDIKYETSEPVNVSLAGWNKVLIMNNGNTLFFHFEPRKGIIVKVYDKTHKETASLKHLCNVFDINALGDTYLDGLVEVNGEALLFATQYVENKETLLRLRIDGNTGKLLAEDKLVKSASFHHLTRAFLLKDREQETYSLLTYQNKPGYPQKSINLLRFNEKNEKIKELPLGINQEGYDDISIRSAQTDGNGGVIFVVQLCKIVQYPNMSCEHILAYLPKDADNYTLRKMKLPVTTDKYDLDITHNTFSKSLNMLITASDANAKSGSYNVQTLVMMNEDLSGPRQLPFPNQKIKDDIKQQLGNEYGFSGGVINLSTNKDGISTVVYSGQVQKADMLGKYEGAKGTISFARFNEKGEEVSGTSLVRSGLVNNDKYADVFRHHNSATELCQAICYNSKDNFLIVFNELDKNYDQDLKNACNMVYNVNTANALCYRLNRNKELTKQWLFGSQPEGEYKQVYSGSGDFDKTTNMYATVYLDRKGKEKTTRIAWFQLEP